MAPPWPISPPTSLPRFPGSGWEYDEPVSQPVVDRAWALLPSLWQRGEGAYEIEWTAGHYVAYKAERMAGGKMGVTAWRLKRGAAPSAVPSAPSSPVIPAGGFRRPDIVVPVNPAAAAMTPAQAQGALNELGYGPLSVDGIIGPKTRAAARRFQGANPPLAVDGILGPKTKSVLAARLAAKRGAAA